MADRLLRDTAERIRMNAQRRVLVVARNARVAEHLVAWLAESGLDTVVVKTFADAKPHLAQRPSLLVSDVKLAEYNGLHLALRAAAAGVPAIVMGPEDPVLRRDAEAIQAIYLTSLTRSRVLEAVASLLPSIGVPPARTYLPFPARATTIAAEAEVIWRAFVESSSPRLKAFGRTMLPN
jgi:CheY-like chemotaxis protein